MNFPELFSDLPSYPPFRLSSVQRYRTSRSVPPSCARPCLPKTIEELLSKPAAEMRQGLRNIPIEEMYCLTFHGEIMKQLQPDSAAALQSVYQERRGELAQHAADMEEWAREEQPSRPIALDTTPTAEEWVPHDPIPPGGYATDSQGRILDPQTGHTMDPHSPHWRAAFERNMLPRNQLDGDA